MATANSVINAIRFNCKGINSNFNYVQQLLQNDCDIIFVCEHWLKLSELYKANNTFKERGFWCNLKSSVPEDEVLIGRPFGRVGFVCVKIQNCTIKEIPQEDNRLSVIQLINNKSVLVTLIGVYLSYSCASSTPQYNEALDKIYAIAKTVNSPIILLGDMNAHLPQQNNLSVNWYKQGLLIGTVYFFMISLANTACYLLISNLSNH